MSSVLGNKPNNVTFGDVMTFWKDQCIINLDSIAACCSSSQDVIISQSLSVYLHCNIVFLIHGIRPVINLSSFIIHDQDAE